MSQITKLSSIFLVLFFQLHLSVTDVIGQDETVQISSTTASGLSSEGYRYFDIDQYQQKTLFKVNVLPYLRYSGDYGEQILVLYSVGVETKITPSLSLVLNAEQLVGQFAFNLSAETRYYPSKRKTAPRGKHNVNNFSGSYIGFGYLRDLSYFDLESYYEVFQLSFGRQKKVGKWGFYDIRTVFNFLPIPRASIFQLGIGLNAGIGYGSTRYIPKSLYEIENEETEVPKWEQYIVGLSSPGLFSDGYTSGFGLSGSAEIPMRDHFTFKPIINALLYSTFWGPQLDGEIDFQLRKYVGVEKKLRKGKKSLAYSGNYVGFNYRRPLTTWSAYVPEEINNDLASYGLSSVNAIVGWQERIGKRFYFDVHGFIGRRVGRQYYYNESRLSLGLSTQLGFLLKN